MITHTHSVLVEAVLQCKHNFHTEENITFVDLTSRNVGK
jgi:hypothetical protein